MTAFVPSYDVETNEAHDNDACLASCRAVVELHERLGIPATLFIVGKALVAREPEYRAMLRGNPLFEVASHSWSHQLLAEHPYGSTPLASYEWPAELKQGKDAVEQMTGQECSGFRPACGWPDGLNVLPLLPWAVKTTGFAYVSSQLWGPGFTMPAPLRSPWRYAVSRLWEMPTPLMRPWRYAVPGLWEMPAHGWHDNILSGVSPGQYRVRWPFFPWTFAGAVTWPDSDPAPYLRCIEWASRFVPELPYLSFIWHPWSLCQIDPTLGYVEKTLRYVRECGGTYSTFAQEYARNATDNG